MRKKDNKTTLGVADGLDFFNIEEEPVRELPKIEKESSEPKKTSTLENQPAEVDPTRNYSPYYIPKPKLGSKGGKLGRGSVPESERKVQFSLTCTPAQKEMFAEAAKKEKRKLPDFICIAVEEYIQNHNLF